MSRRYTDIAAALSPASITAELVWKCPATVYFRRVKTVIEAAAFFPWVITMVISGWVAAIKVLIYTFSAAAFFPLFATLITAFGTPIPTGASTVKACAVT
jgi:hypothetical protein